MGQQLHPLPMNTDSQRPSAPKTASLPFPASCKACQCVLCRPFVTRILPCLLMHTRQHGLEEVSPLLQTLHIKWP